MIKMFRICAILLVAASASLPFAACKPNQRIIESSKEHSLEPLPSVSPTPENSFEQDVASMKTAGFVFIYVYRRKDGGVLDTEDRKFGARTIPPEMNRRTVSDQDKAIIVGSNFRMPKEAQKLLAERFAFTDLSDGDNEQKPNN